MKVLFSLVLGQRAIFLLSFIFISTDALSHSIVTGANGYLGREIVHSLLQEESTDTIVCLVRPSRVESEESYWKTTTTKQSDAIVRVMPYDMLDEGITLEAALKTCQHIDDDNIDSSRNVLVYHVASTFGPTENPVETAKNNVQGTLEVVRTMAKFPNSCLVLTSSMAAVRGTGQPPQNGKYYTHFDWNTLSQLGGNKKDQWGSSYQWSKAQSELQAVELGKSLGVPITSLCPSFIFGPTSSSSSVIMSNSYSIQLVGQWVRGESPVQSRLCVDVRDVAKAHVVAGQRLLIDKNDKSGGERFILSRDARLPSKEMAGALGRHNKSAEREITFDAEFMGGAIPIGEKEVDAEDRLKAELGITLRPVEETMADMALMLTKMSV